jgi:hypothetical protein
MTEFIVRPPILLLAVPVGIFGVVLASVLLRRGDGTRKAIALVLAVVVLGVFVGTTWRTRYVRIDDAGISTNAVGTLSLPWDRVASARFDRTGPASEFWPVARTAGTSMGSYHAGWFRLRNGESARLFVQGDGPRLVLRTPDALYVLGFDGIDEAVEAIAAHVAVEEWSP